MKETYKIIKDYPNYEVSSEGRVRNTKTGRILRPNLNEGGYQQVNLYLDRKPKLFRVHRLVASTFIPNPENKRTVNHINGDKTDNRVDNLEWASDSENVSHAFRAGLKFHSGGVPKQRVRCIETGQEFESQHHAARYFCCDSGSIRQSIHTGCRCKGYHFKII